MPQSLQCCQVLCWVLEEFSYFRVLSLCEQDLVYPQEEQVLPEKEWFSQPEYPYPVRVLPQELHFES